MPARIQLLAEILRAVKDSAKRNVKVIQNFNSIANIEDEKQCLLLVALEHRASSLKLGSHHCLIKSESNKLSIECCILDMEVSGYSLVVNALDC